MWVYDHTCSFISHYFDIDQRHSSSKQIEKENKPRRKVIGLDNTIKDRFKWYIVQMETSPRKPACLKSFKSCNCYSCKHTYLLRDHIGNHIISIVGYRFSGSRLKKGMENNIFWSEIGSGF